MTADRPGHDCDCPVRDLGLHRNDCPNRPDCVCEPLPPHRRCDLRCDLAAAVAARPAGHDEAAPVTDQAREDIARLLFGFDNGIDWSLITEQQRDTYRADADAVLATATLRRLRDAEAAVERVRAEVDRLERLAAHHAGQSGEKALGKTLRGKHEGCSIAYNAAVRDLRRALGDLP